MAFGKAVRLWRGGGRGARLKLGRPPLSSRLNIMLVLPKVVVLGSREAGLWCGSCGVGERSEVISSLLA